MAHAGQRTAVVERQWVGGSCPNINCLPSKNEIWSAKVADLVHRAAAFGTVALVAHVERVCRELLEPHLEPGEDGIGSRIEVAHRAPVPIGETVTLVATVASVTQRKLVCEILVRHAGLIVARGSFEQSLIDLEEFGAQVELRRAVVQPT
jgi:predicted thioesterase